jgi:hypothetical protein
VPEELTPQFTDVEDQPATVRKKKTIAQGFQDGRLSCCAMPA